MRRRAFLLSGGAMLLVGGAGCARPAGRATGVAATLPVEQRAAWEQEARAVLSDAIDTLRTLDILAAYRASRGRESGPELTWDPPLTAEWQEATHVTIGMRGRADHLLQTIGTASIDPSAWRERRDIASAAHDLLDLADALGTCRERLEAGADEGENVRMLEATWTRWDQVAGRWGVARAQPISCGG